MITVIGYIHISVCIYCYSMWIYKLAIARTICPPFSYECTFTAENLYSMIAEIGHIHISVSIKGYALCMIKLTVALARCSQFS